MGMEVGRGRGIRIGIRIGIRFVRGFEWGLGVVDSSIYPLYAY